VPWSLFRVKCSIEWCFSVHLGNMAAFDMGDPLSVVSPGGVGFDINCGVRLLRTNLHEKDVLPVKVSTLLSFTHTHTSMLSLNTFYDVLYWT